MAMGQKPTGMRKGGMGGRTGDMMYSRGYGVGQKSKRMPTMLKDRGAMKKGGMMKPKKMVLGALAMGAAGALAAKKMFGKKKSSSDAPKGMGGMAAKLSAEKMKKQKEMTQGKMGGGMMSPRYKKGGVAKKKKPMKGRMSPARRVTGTNPNRPINPTNPGFPFTPRPRPQQKRMMGGGVAEAARKVTSGMKKGGLKAVDKKKNPGLAKLPTSVRNKMGYMKRGGRTNTRRMNRLEELGRVDAEKAYTRKGKRNLKSEKRRIVRELKK